MNVWDPRRGKRLATLEMRASNAIRARLAPDGSRATVVFADGVVRLFDIPLEQRSREEIDLLLRCYVPLRLIDDRVASAAPDPSACRQVFTVERLGRKPGSSRPGERVSP